MIKRTAAATLSALCVTAVLGAAPAHGATVQKERDYLVTFATGVGNSVGVGTTVKQGGRIKRQFNRAINGALVSLTPNEANALRGAAGILRVEADGPVSILDSQSPTPSWGLDRVDQPSLPGDNTYTYASSGSGVTAYVIDTGVYADHGDIAGRVDGGYTAISDGNGSSDCNGHGTHVSGTIGGTSYGVAKRVTIVPVRVLDCSGSGTWSGVVAGMDWVVNHHQAGVPAVANMSLGGGASATIDDAVQRLVDDGIVVAVAAGNSNLDACNYSPARATSAITVGATSSNDARASYSNFGTCLDVFAPGSAITSSWIGGTNASATISGTSMASPHVAGIAAVMLGQNPTLSVASVTSTLVASATQGVVSSAGVGSPNLMLYSPPMGFFPVTTTTLATTTTSTAPSTTTSTTTTSTSTSSTTMPPTSTSTTTSTTMPPTSTTSTTSTTTTTVKKNVPKKRKYFRRGFWD